MAQKGMHVYELLKEQYETYMAVTSPLVFLGNKGEGQRPTIQWIRTEPGMVTPPHGHRGWTCTVLLEGSMRIGTEVFHAGQAVVVEPFIEYGPFEAGDDGCTSIEFFDSQAAVTPLWDESDPRVIKQYESMGHGHDGH